MLVAIIRFQERKFQPLWVENDDCDNDFIIFLVMMEISYYGSCIMNSICSLYKVATIKTMERETSEDTEYS